MQKVNNEGSGENRGKLMKGEAETNNVHFNEVMWAYIQYYHYFVITCKEKTQRWTTRSHLRTK